MSPSLREEVDVVTSASGVQADAKSTTPNESSTMAQDPEIGSNSDHKTNAISAQTEGSHMFKPTLEVAPSTPSPHSITPPSPSSPLSFPSEPPSNNDLTLASEDVGKSTPVSDLKPPYMLRYRCSTTFIAMTVALGVLVDLAGYGIVVPVIPFRLQALGYDNIGAKVGWLVSAYAGGLIVSSPPIAYLGERIKGRRGPLIFGLMFMAGALVLFMETESYTALVISRVLQGISGTSLWTLGLALITDSVPEERVGIVMGYVMIGFSIGSLVGPPIGGVLYSRLGYRAPFIFILCLVFVDLVMRLFVIEKHVALRWIDKGVEIPNFEAPGYVAPASSRTLSKSSFDSPPTTSSIQYGSEELNIGGGEKEEKVTKGRARRDHKASPWPALLHMVTAPRPVTLFILSGFQGFVIGGVLDTGMVLWLQERYGLDALGAGLVFIGAVVPSFVAAPFAGWAADRYGAKGITIAGLILAIPAFPLLIIGGPLPLFIFFLVMVGFSLAFFLTPLMQDLSIVVSQTPGLGAAHVYGCFNLMYSIGAFIGPLIAGQIIEAVGITKGWIAINILASGLILFLAPMVLLFVGGPLKRFQKAEVAVEEKETPSEDVERGNVPSTLE